jgi:hypothetical protein
MGVNRVQPYIIKIFYWYQTKQKHFHLMVPESEMIPNRAHVPPPPRLLQALQHHQMATL